MRKLKLDIDALEVESFASMPHPTREGTVAAHKGEVYDPDPVPQPDTPICDGGGFGSLFGTCKGCPTVGTCVGPTYCCTPTWQPTCNPSCNWTCYTMPCGI